MKRLMLLGLFSLCALGSTSGIVLAQSEPQDNSHAVADTSPPAQWWKGNLHTHSLWSDGDDFPEMIAAWYVEHDYNFLALSDHNVLSSGLRWMPYSAIVARADEGILQRYRQRFGKAWVETRTQAASTAGEPDVLEVRLKPLDEFRCLVEQAGKFIMLQAEEISDSAEGKPVHMNVTNVQELIKPVGGATVREAMRNNLRLIFEQESATGRELLAHLNHPNFHYAVTAEDIANVVQEQFFEVYNGHPGVNQLGDETHMSIERMWDVANAIRLCQLDADLLLGIATDDSHEYHGQQGPRPGRGWVMVKAQYLTPEQLIRALKSADFYASSGVVLEAIDFNRDAGTLVVSIPEVEGQQFTTEFIATLRPPVEGELPTPTDIGKVVATVQGPVASYTMTGKELYVRARITSTQPHVDPSLEGQMQEAWTQPFRK